MDGNSLIEDGKYIEEVASKAAEKIVSQNTSSGDEAYEIISDLILKDQLKGIKENHIDEVSLLGKMIFGKLRGSLGSISHLLQDEEVNEIMINGPGSGFIERHGKMTQVGRVFSGEEELNQIIRRIAASCRREISELTPILDARLQDGSRVNAVLGNVALDGPALTIRKFGQKKITMAEMVRGGVLTEEARRSLEILVKGGFNIFVSGGTSSGKTTFLNALSEFIPRDERVITIEDSAELKIEGIDNLVRLECKNANSVGKGRVTMAMLIKSSLRMRPDRIVVGEVRGEEVSDMLQALNTGHSGMSTGHGNTIKGMLRRLEAMYIMGSPMPMDAIRAQVVEGIDVMVHVARLAGGERKVLEIAEVVGYEGGEYIINTLYSVDENLKLQKGRAELKDDVKLKLKGLKYE